MLRQSTGTYAFSSTQMQAHGAALRHLGFDDVLTEASDPLKTCLQGPRSQPWWPAPIVDELFIRIEAKYGREGLVRLGESLCTVGLGKLVMPVLRLSLTLFKRSPAGLFHRANDLLPLFFQGVSGHFDQRDEGGVFTITYSSPTDPTSLPLWEGVVHFGFGLTAFGGRTLRAEHQSTQVIIDVAWPA
jgi:hypothetical protein